ncbi:MAG: MotA/TolQ/ExbB proton channel family protein [Candidatus Auribacterota bacterium]
MSHPLITSFTSSGPIGQGIMIILLILSITAWSVIIEKLIFFRKLNREGREFLDFFRGSVNSLEKAFQNSNQTNASLLSAVFSTGIKELRKITSSDTRYTSLTKSQQNDLELSLKRIMSQKAQTLERNMIILATSANISPLLGLLGTVYGLLIAFYDMGRMGSASIDAVAPGISEALITTVIGLFVAIPSGVGYNYLLNSIRNLMIDMENFATEFLSLVERGHND